MNETATDSGNGGGIRIHPPILAAGLLIVTLLLHLLGGHHHHYYYYHRGVRLHELVGLLIVAAGACLSAYAAGIFSGKNTTRSPYGDPAEFVSIAPFTFTRNPMYLGVTVVLFGFAIFFASPVMVLAPVIFFLVIDRMVIPGEERALESRFGAAYQDYQRRVRRWL